MTGLGFQASSLKPYLTTPEDVENSLYRIKNIGYKHLQIQWISPSVPLEYTAKVLQQTGLTCVATQDSFKNVQSNLDYYIQMNKLWKSPSLCVSAIPKEFMTESGLDIFVSEMKQIRQALSLEGIAMSFHPLSFNFQLVNDVNAVDTVMELLPSEVGLTLCVLQAIRAGINPVSILERYSGRIEVCHFKDYDILPDGEEYLVPVGQGQIDWQPIFDACHRTNVKWGLAEQEEWKKDAFLCAKESFNYISACGITVPQQDSNLLRCGE